MEKLLDLAAVTVGKKNNFVGECTEKVSAIANIFRIQWPIRLYMPPFLNRNSWNALRIHSNIL